MIDFKNEQPITFAEAADLVPTKVHRATITRWADGLGVNGIVLENVRIGGRRYTTPSALAKFLEDCQERDSINNLSPEMQDRMLAAKAELAGKFTNGADHDEELLTDKQSTRRKKPNGHRRTKV